MRLAETSFNQLLRSDEKTVTKSTLDLAYPRVEEDQTAAYVTTML